MLDPADNVFFPPFLRPGAIIPSQHPKGLEVSDFDHDLKIASSPFKGIKKIIIKKDVKINTQDLRSITPLPYTSKDRQRSDRISQGKTTRKRSDLNISQIDGSDPDFFFENFDKMFRVRENIKEEAKIPPEPVKTRNIRRILLDDFSVSPPRPSSCKPDHSTGERLSVKFITSKEKGMPKLDDLAFRPFANPKNEVNIPTTAASHHSAATEELRDGSKETFADMMKLELNSKLAREKLPDLKIPKSMVNNNKPSSFNRLPNEGATRIVEKINKFHENFMSRSKVKVTLTAKGATNINTTTTTTTTAKLDSVLEKAKNSHQELQNLLKFKKMEKGENKPGARSKTVLGEVGNHNNNRDKDKDKDSSVGERRMTHNDEMRPRVNSMQVMENSMRKMMAANKNDLSLDLGTGDTSKVQAILKNLEQRTSNYYYQGFLGKVSGNGHNGEKEGKSNNITARSQYYKENLSLLLNSSREKMLEGVGGRGIRDRTNIPIKQVDPGLLQKNGQQNVKGQTCRIKVGDIAQLYKGPKKSSKSKDQYKEVSSSNSGNNGRVAMNQFNPFKEVNNVSMEGRATSVPRR